jgi:hypothetical protein
MEQETEFRYSILNMAFLDFGISRFRSWDQLFEFVGFSGRQMLGKMVSYVHSDSFLY